MTRKLVQVMPTTIIHRLLSHSADEMEFKSKIKQNSDDIFTITLSKDIEHFKPLPDQSIENQKKVQIFRDEQNHNNKFNIINFKYSCLFAPCKFFHCFNFPISHVPFVILMLQTKFNKFYLRILLSVDSLGSNCYKEIEKCSLFVAFCPNF